MPGTEVSLPSLSLSGVSHAGGTVTEGAGIRGSLASLPGTGDPAVADIPARPRPSPLKVILPVLVVAAGGLGAYFWTQQRPVSVTRISVGDDAPDEAARGATNPNQATPEGSAGSADRDAGARSPGGGTTERSGGRARGGRSVARQPGSGDADEKTPGDETAADEKPGEATPDEPTSDTDTPVIDPVTLEDLPSQPAGGTPTPGTRSPGTQPKKRGKDPDFSNPYR